MKATSLAVTAMAMACSIVTASVAADHSPTGAEKTHQPTLQSSPEYQEAEDQFRKYQQAYDRGDTKILASFYADDIDYIDQDGLEVKGRGEMEKLFMKNFQANPGAKIAITIEEVKPLTPDVQVNRGVATISELPTFCRTIAAPRPKTCSPRSTTIRSLGNRRTVPWVAGRSHHSQRSWRIAPDQTHNLSLLTDP
jgi:uncharacterized protein (TIGR02246 family)